MLRVVVLHSHVFVHAVLLTADQLVFRPDRFAPQAPENGAAQARNNAGLRYDIGVDYGIMLRGDT